MPPILEINANTLNLFVLLPGINTEKAGSCITG